MHTPELQSQSYWHPRQVEVPVSQKGVVPEQPALLPLHPTQAPDPLQAVGAAQFSGAAVHASQVFDAGLQIGVVPEHPELSAGSQTSQALPTH